MAREARAGGGDGLATRLEDEAAAEERHLGQLLAMLEGLVDDDAVDRPGR